MLVTGLLANLREERRLRSRNEVRNLNARRRKADLPFCKRRQRIKLPQVKNFLKCIKYFENRSLTNSPISPNIHLIK